MLRPPLKRMASSAALDDALDDGVSPVRVYARPHAHHHDIHRRSRGSSVASQLALYGPHVAIPPGTNLGWRDRAWLWRYRLERWMFKGIPPGYPLRAKVKITMQASTFGWAWDLTQTFASLASCIIYVLSTYNFRIPVFVEGFLTAFFTAELLLRYYVSEDRLLHTFKVPTIIDWLTVLPAYLEYAVQHTHAALGSNLLFLRVARLTRVLRVMRTWRVMDQQHVSKTDRQYGQLILTVIALVFVSAALVQMVEPGMDFGTAVYFMVVTMSTVGYGDLAPTTVWGQVVVSGIIAFSWILVPYEISKLFQVLSTRSQYRTRVRRRQPTSHKQEGGKGRAGHVLVVGDVANVFKLQKFVSEFYHPDRPAAARRVRLVIVGPDEPVRELRELMLNPILQGRISYVKASVMREPDLERVAADEATAAFVLSDWLSAAAPEQEDGRAIIRTLMLNNFAPRVPCFVQLSEPYSVFQLSLSPGNHIICADSLKMAILGLAVTNPGVTTLVTNMMTSSRATDARVRSRESPPWLHEYLEGTNYELYVTALPPAMGGMSFHEAVLFAYTQTNGRVLLLGLKEAAEQRPLPRTGGGNMPQPPPPARLLCNPGPLHRIPPTDTDMPTTTTADAMPTTPAPASSFPAPFSPGTTTAGGKNNSSSSKGQHQAIFLAADTDEVDRLQLLRPPTPRFVPGASSEEGRSMGDTIRRRSSRSSSFGAHVVEEVRAVFSASLSARRRTLSAAAPLPPSDTAAAPPSSLMGTGQRIVEFAPSKEDELQPPSIESAVRTSGGGGSSRVLPLPGDEEAAAAGAIPPLPSNSVAAPMPQQQQEQQAPTVVLSREASGLSLLSSSSSSPPPLANEGEEGGREIAAAIPVLDNAEGYHSSPPVSPPLPHQAEEEAAPSSPQRNRPRAFSLGGHPSIEAYLQSLAVEGHCLEIRRAGVRRLGLRALRALEGHVVVVCQLASLPCLGYFLAPLRQRRRQWEQQQATDDAGKAKAAADADKAVHNGPSVVVLISLTAEPGSKAPAAGGAAPSRRKGLRKAIEGLRQFGPIYLVEGDAATEDGLVKAGLERARACVMLADKTSTKLVDGRHFVDNASLRRFLSVQKFLFDAASSYSASSACRADFAYLAEVQSSTTLRIMDRYQEKVRTAPRAVLLHSLRELSYHGGAGGTVKRVSETAKALGSAALGTLKRSASFRGGDELESRFEASRAVSFGVKEAYMLPFFVAGRGFVTHLFDTLPCQAYFSPEAVRFMELLVGHSPDPEGGNLPPTNAHHGGGGGRASQDYRPHRAQTEDHQQQHHHHHHQQSLRPSDSGMAPPPPPFRGQLKRIPVPLIFLVDRDERVRGCSLPLATPRPETAAAMPASSLATGASNVSNSHEGAEESTATVAPAAAAADASEATFGALVRYLLLTRGLLPIGLYRLCPATGQHYVVTAPPAALLLAPSDHAFVLTPGGALLPHQQAQLAADEREEEEEAAARRRGRRRGRERGQERGGGERTEGGEARRRLESLFLDVNVHGA